MSAPPTQPFVSPHRPRTPVYLIAGVHRVTTLLDRIDSADRLDALEIVSPAGTTCPMHRHHFTVWYRVLDGELQVSQKGQRPGFAHHVLGPGQSLLVAPATYHTLSNPGPHACRIQIISQPAMLSGFVAEAGTRTYNRIDESTGAPATSGHERLIDLARRWGIDVEQDRTASSEV